MKRTTYKNSADFFSYYIVPIRIVVQELFEHNFWRNCELSPKDFTFFFKII